MKKLTFLSVIALTLVFTASLFAAGVPDLIKNKSASGLAKLDFATYNSTNQGGKSTFINEALMNPKEFPKLFALILNAATFKDGVEQTQLALIGELKNAAYAIQQKDKKRYSRMVTGKAKRAKNPKIKSALEDLAATIGK